MRKLFLAFAAWVFLYPTSVASVTAYQAKDYTREGVSLGLTDPSGSVYSVGEAIRLTIETDANAYVVLFDIDTEGFVNLLYPRDIEIFQKFYGGQKYKIPSRADEAFIVSGPTGMEFARARAVFTASITTSRRCTSAALRPGEIMPVQS